MDKEMDERFSEVLTDPRFRTLRKCDKKVKVDKRFKNMFSGNKFKLKYSMDKRGKHIKHNNSEDFKKFYDLSDSEKESEEESKCDKEIELNLKIPEKPKIPNARGMDSDEENVTTSDSSSDSDDSDSDESQEFDHKWNEWDKDVPEVETATKRLAICNIDWDRINANDLFVLINSFKPSGGSIHSVKIYPSKLGLERMKVEEESGPIRFINNNNNHKNESQNQPKNDNIVNNDDEEEEEEEEVAHNSPRTTEQLRQYQLSRLQYFYAVVECDTEATANVLYNELDGMEYESSSSTLDLRFIPEDMTFEEKPKTECYSMPDFATYKAPQFINSALQQSKVMLTWDETDPKRRDIFERAFNKEADDDLKAYLASSSDEDEDIEEVTDSNDDSQLESKDKINKYKQLLNSLNEHKDKDEGNIEMEISWEPNLKDVAEDIVNRKEREKDISTFEENYNKQKQKRKEKIVNQSEESDQTNDEIKTDAKSQKLKNRKAFKKGIKSMDDSEDGNLELLLMDATEDSNKKHFNYKNMIEDDINKKKSKQKLVDDDFKVSFILIINFS
jgi:hypothetical protein